jgi:hypothetical protein
MPGSNRTTKTQKELKEMPQSPRLATLLRAIAEQKKHAGINQLVDDSVLAYTSPNFEKGRGHCQIQARLHQSIHFLSVAERYRRGTAKATGLAFKKSPYYVPVWRGSIPGDFIYTPVGSGGFGHVRFRGFKWFFQNSVVHFDEVEKDGRGAIPSYTLKPWDIIVRIIPPK